MAVSEAQKLAVEKYRREKRDQLAVDVPKGKRDAYKMIAAEKGLSLSQLIQNSVESFAGLHVGELPATSPKPESISAADKRLVEEFNQLPVDAQKHLMKFLKSINENTPH